MFVLFVQTKWKLCFFIDNIIIQFCILCKGFFYNIHSAMFYRIMQNIKIVL